MAVSDFLTPDETQASAPPAGVGIGRFLTPTDKPSGAPREPRLGIGRFLTEPPAEPSQMSDTTVPGLVIGRFLREPAAPRTTTFSTDQESIRGTIRRTAQQYNVPESIALGVGKMESNYNPHARSKAGALGVMQLMPDTAKGLGVDPTNPEQNILGGIKYLDQMYRRYGNWEQALAAYNAGPGAVDKAIRDSQFDEAKALRMAGATAQKRTWLDRLPDETKAYVRGLTPFLEGRAADRPAYRPPTLTSTQVMRAPTPDERARMELARGGQVMRAPTAFEAAQMASGRPDPYGAVTFRSGTPPTNLPGAITRGLLRGAISPLNDPHLQKPADETGLASHAEDVATVVGQFLPVGLSMGAVSAVGLARLSRVMTPVVYRIVQAGGGGALFQATDAAVNHYDEIRKMSVPDAAKYLGKQAGIGALQWAAMQGAFEGLAQVAKLGGAGIEYLRGVRDQAALSPAERARAQAEAIANTLPVRTAPSATARPADVTPTVPPVRPTSTGPTTREDFYAPTGPVGTAMMDRMRAALGSPAAQAADARLAQLREQVPFRVGFTTENTHGVPIKILSGPDARGRWLVDWQGVSQQWIREEALRRELGMPLVAAPAKALPPRTSSTMGEAISMSSPSGRVSARSRRAAEERLRRNLFGEGGLPAPTAVQPTTAETLRQQARELRDLAARGMKPQAYAREAARLEAEVSQMEASAAPRAAGEPPMLLGAVAPMETPRGTAVNVQYAVVEAADLRSSHDPFTLGRTPGYPEDLQPRMRERVASEQQITGLVNVIRRHPLTVVDLSGDASRGVPVVGPDLAVESGNGRVMAIVRAYRQVPEARDVYRGAIEAAAERAGIPVDRLAGMREPVLVAIRRTPMDRVRFATEANESTQLSMSAVELARSDAQRLTPDLMASFIPSETGEINTATNRDFQRSFFGKLVSPGDLGRYVREDGSISQEGVSRIRNAIFAKAYGGDPGALEKLAESPDPNVRNFINGLTRAAGRVAQVEDRIAQGDLYPLSIGADVAAAMNKLSALREGGTSVDRYLSQVSLFGADLSEDQVTLLRMLDERSRSAAKVSDLLEAYADRVETLGSPNQVSLLGSTELPTKGQVLASITGESTARARVAAERETPAQSLGGLFGPQPAGILPPGAQVAQAVLQSAASKVQDTLDALHDLVAPSTGRRIAALPMARLKKDAIGERDLFVVRSNNFWVHTVGPDLEHFARGSGERDATLLRSAMSLYLDGQRNPEGVRAALPGALQQMPELRPVVDRMQRMTPAEKRYALDVINRYDQGRGFYRLSQDVQTQILNFHVSHLWEERPTAAGPVKMPGPKTGGGLNPYSSFSRTRRIPTFIEGIASGFKPKTLDIVEINRLVDLDTARAVMARQLRDGMEKSGLGVWAYAKNAPMGWFDLGRTMRTFVRDVPIQEGGDTLGVPIAPGTVRRGMRVRSVVSGEVGTVSKINAQTGEAVLRMPRGARTVLLWGQPNRPPQMSLGTVPGNPPDAYERLVRGAPKRIAVREQHFYVDPDTYKHIQYMVEGDPLRGYRGISAILRYNGFVKMTELSFSFFHDFNMMRLMALTRPRTAAQFLKAPTGYRNIEPVRQGLAWLQEADTNPEIRALVRAGLTTGRESNFDAFLDILGKRSAVYRIPLVERHQHALWDVLYPGLKAYDAVLTSREWLRKFAGIENPATGRLWTPDDILEATAQHINDKYGGQHWDRAGTTFFMRSLLRVLMLAPDWTISALRLGSEAVRGGIVARPGTMFASTPSAAMARQTLAKIAASWFVGIQAVNMMLNQGRTTFQNDEGRWYQVQLPWRTKDGRALFVDPLQPSNIRDLTMLAGAVGSDLWNLLAEHGAAPMATGTTLQRFVESRTSPLLRTVSNVVSGVDWRGQPIVQRGMNLGEELRARAEQIGSSIAPVPFPAQAVYEWATGKIDPTQAASQVAGTGPVQRGSPPFDQQMLNRLPRVERLRALQRIAAAAPGDRTKIARELVDRFEFERRTYFYPTARAKAEAGDRAGAYKYLRQNGISDQGARQFLRTIPLPGAPPPGFSGLRKPPAPAPAHRPGFGGLRIGP